MGSMLGWGIIGTGAIARAFAKGLAKSTTGRLVAVGSRTQAAAAKFGDEFGVPHRFGAYEELLADPAVEAVYISTPHPLHAEWAIKAAEAGKHILCEKPLTLNHADAMAVVEAAIRHDVFLMEAFMYRCNPQTAKLVELVRSRVIGDVRLIQATFSFRCGWNPESRLLQNALGGGGILDVGCYCTSMARLLAGAALGRDFSEPFDVMAAGHIGLTNVDEYAVATLRFPGGIVAQLATGVQLAQDNVVRVYGTEGNIVVPSPWFCGGDAGRSTINVNRAGKPAEEIVITAPVGIYTIEADTVAANIAARQAPAMRWDDTLGNMKTLDRWRRAIGMAYEAEQAEAQRSTVDRRPLRVRPDACIPHDRIEGLEQPVSRLIMGTMAPDSLPYASVMYDDFFAKGGNCFDTAYVYGGGHAERLLGQWVRNRGVRQDVIVICKGAIPPFCTPEGLSTQLLESLERFGLEYVDIYMMHRDNPAVPIGEFVDVLNGHKRAGRIRLFGGSNWTMARLDEANAYARQHGLAGMSVVSNNFSLARMVNPVWAGTVASSDPAWRAWLTRTRMPLLAWSSQARGFFTRGDPANFSDQEVVRSWYSEDNFRRLERARQLASERGVEPVHIALAYVLAQPFPVFPMIGPFTLAETRSSMRALDVNLTAQDLKWLNLEADER